MLLKDDTGHSWRRVADWVEPSEADRLIGDGVRFVVERCLAEPKRGRVERYKKDVRAEMLTRQEAVACEGRRAVPTIMVGELWRSKSDGDLLVFVEQGPSPR